jgi:hypothetical protein
VQEKLEDPEMSPSRFGGSMRRRTQHLQKGVFRCAGSMIWSETILLERPWVVVKVAATWNSMSAGRWESDMVVPA